jgi:hypothetical protein
MPIMLSIKRRFIYLPPKDAKTTVCIVRGIGAFCIDGLSRSIHVVAITRCPWGGMVKSYSG